MLIVIVNAESPHKTLKDLVTWTKANPSASNYASASPTFTLAAELLKLRTGAVMQRVSYRGTNDVAMAVLGNQVFFGCVNAHRRDFEAGARHMATWTRRWPGLLEGLVTRQVPPERFEAAVARQPDDIKTVVRFAE